MRLRECNDAAQYRTVYEADRVSELGPDVAACNSIQTGSGSDLVVYEVVNYAQLERMLDFVVKGIP